MFREHLKEYKFMEDLESKNDLVFNCAITHLVENGMDKCKECDIAEIEKNISENSLVSKRFQIAIFETAKEIAENVRPWVIATYFKYKEREGKSYSYKELLEIINYLVDYIMCPDMDYPGKTTTDDLVEIMRLYSKEDFYEIIGTNYED